MNDHTHLPIGAEFHGYRIDALIGHGGMGVVYRAFDLRLKRHVALKLMAPDLSRDARFRERFAREAQLAMVLEHPNVVPIHDAGEADGQLYLIMRDVEGTDLRTLLQREGPLAPARALAIVTQVAAALDAAHAQGLVHRDVKPSNVLLDGGEHAYLADFGLTRRFSDESVLTADTRSLGTPAYLAPEQIEGGPVDGRADIYSLACLLFECLTGTAPFSSDSRLGVAWAHLEEEPPSLSARMRGLPGAADAIVAKGMAKAPGDRYATCAELVRAAAEALGLEASRRRGRSVVALGAAAAAVVIAAAAVAALAFTRGDAAAGSPPAVHANSLVRLDPRTNDIAAVIDVGEGPIATAAAGHTVWVYNADDRTVSEVDGRTNEVRDLTPVSTTPLTYGNDSGPLLTADDGGAWLIGIVVRSGRTLLTRLPAGPRGKIEYPLDGALLGVVAGQGDMWLLAGRKRGNVVLRINPRTGKTRQTIPLGTGSAASIGFGYGRVWVVSQEAALYRIDARSGVVTGKRMVGDCAARPGIGLGSVWLCVCNPGSSMLRIDPDTLRNQLARNAVRAQEGMFSLGFGSVWWSDEPNGTVIRFAPKTGDRAATAFVTSSVPGLAPESMSAGSLSAGAGAVWIAVAKD
jgi:tRNA A-37 threonylcarbamoyl transferase component Bud32/streptogramin lyase